MFKFFYRIMKGLGFIPVAQERQLIREVVLLEQENDTLLKEMTRIQDENGSLWDMLDEIKKSDICEV